jgi:DNA-directed RNA polymerase specialized sigma24 family protein
MFTNFGRLHQVDWNTIGIQLAGYARWKARRLRWRSGRAEDLAKGKTPEDVAAEAIEKALNGTRALNLETNEDLLNCLKSIVDSDINHLVQSADNLRQRPVSENQDGEELRDKMEFAAAHDNYNELISQQPSSPEDHLVHIDEQEAERRIDSLLKSLAGEKDLMEVLEAMLEGEAKPKDIADRLKTSVFDINNRLKRIRRHARKNSSSAINVTTQREIP